MSKTNQISGVDTLGYEWHAACGDALEPEARADGSVAMLNFQDDGGHFSDKEAAKLITFLLAAVGPDATREALAKLAPGYEIGECDACQETTLLTPTGKAGAVSICAPCLETSCQEHTASMAEQMSVLAARASLAEKRLERVLALITTWKDDGSTLRHDGDSNYGNALLRCANEAESVIRSRATEGAEDPNKSLPSQWQCEAPGCKWWQLDGQDECADGHPRPGAEAPTGATT